MTIAAEDQNLPWVIAEIRSLFQAYETALMANDAPALNAFFHASAHTTRYGICDRQWGHEELSAWRATVPAPDFTRELLNPRVSSYGPDLAVVMCEFLRSDTPLHGFQTQTWVRMPEGWRIVSAHVSMVAFDSSRTP